MTIPTFSPTYAPSYGPTQYKSRPAVFAAEFGDGYEQVAPAYVNGTPMEATLFWDVLPVEEVAALDAFFDALKGASPFYYTPRGAVTPIKWRATEWGHGEGGSGWVTYTVQMKRVNTNAT